MFDALIGFVRLAAVLAARRDDALPDTRAPPFWLPPRRQQANFGLLSCPVTESERPSSFSWGQGNEMLDCGCCAYLEGLLSPGTAGGASTPCGSASPAELPKLPPAPRVPPRRLISALAQAGASPGRGRFDSGALLCLGTIALAHAPVLQSSVREWRLAPFRSARPTSAAGRPSRR